MLFYLEFFFYVKLLMILYVYFFKGGYMVNKLVMIIFILKFYILLI